MINKIYNVFFRIKRKIFVIIFRSIILPLYKNRELKSNLRYHVKSIENTARKLSNSNDSLGRFGDGEIEWLLGKRSRYMSFEKNSPKLKGRLLGVLQSNNKRFLIGLPDAMNLPKCFTSGSKLFWDIFFFKYDRKFLKYLNYNKIYYNTSVTRPYIDYNYRDIANKTFPLLKSIWDNKNVLIIEGEDSRIGASDDLFKNVNKIRRIECPATNAFESYNKILSFVLDYLNKINTNYLILLSLGPTATVMAYDLCVKGYRAIDIGHVDIEYEWYLIGAKEKINLPYQYVNENRHGHSVLPIKNKKYNEEIIKTFN